MLSINEKIKEASQKLGEPSWLLAWREKRLPEAEKLPKELKYGIGITAVLPQSADWDVEPATGTADYHIDASKGLEVYTWKEAVNQEEIAPIVRGLIESEFFPAASNYWNGMGQALFSSGIVVYVQPNVNERGEYIAEQLTLDAKIPDGNASDVVIVIAKEGARLEMTSAIAGQGKSVFSRTLVVMSERDARVTVTQRSDAAPGAHLLVASRGIAAAHAHVTWNELFAGAGRMKSETESLLVGEGAETAIRHAIVADGASEHDVFASAKHVAARTHSTIKAVGACAGTSKTVYRALIDMPKGASGMSGEEDARFLVLAPAAKVDAIPSLDIAAKDVRCSHKLAITHIRADDVFYPKLRGCSDLESKRMFLEGHFGGLFGGDGSQRLAGELAERLTTITI